MGSQGKETAGVVPLDLRFQNFKYFWLGILAPAGVLSSVGVYSGHLSVPLDAFRAGLGDQTIATTLCPGGKERMRRLMRLVQTHRINLRPLLTHTFTLDNIAQAYNLFESRREGVLKIAIRVS